METELHIIPPDWEVTLRDLYANVLAADYAFIGREQDRCNNPAYIAASEDFLAYVHDIFGSSEKFDQFMQMNVLSALQSKGYNANVPASWDDGMFARQFEDATVEAENVWVTYKLIYQKCMDAVPFLPEATSGMTNYTLS